jgi:CDP-paratose 2-epimerase
VQSRNILITGGAGFIGTNIARSYLQEGLSVHIFDNLSRPEVESNVLALQNEFPGRVLFTKSDVRDRRAIEEAVKYAAAIYHLAAQVAVTTSLDDPISDLETNLLGTIHILEAVRRSKLQPPVLFTSTNKVYGRLGSVSLREGASRYEPEDECICRSGAGENESLEFLSPYGCSKGSADQYVLDYARSFHIDATVFRMSCIYGPYQLGSEDQGWVAHFLRQAMKGEPVTIYGDGKQVRDLLYVGDLVTAMRLTQKNIKTTAGQAFNLGGGPANSTSLIELLEQLRVITGSPVHVDWGPERLADQKWYVANTSKIQSLLGWKPTVSVPEGLRRLHAWYVQRPWLVAQSEVQVA